MQNNNRITILLTLEAKSNLADIAAYHKLKVGVASAKRITDKILDNINKLADFPNMGVAPPSKIIVDAGFRMLIIGEYLCFYIIVGNEVIVHHIVHGSTDYIRALFK